MQSSLAGITLRVDANQYEAKQDPLNHRISFICFPASSIWKQLGFSLDIRHHNYKYAPQIIQCFPPSPLPPTPDSARDPEFLWYIIQDNGLTIQPRYPISLCVHLVMFLEVRNILRMRQVFFSRILVVISVPVSLSAHPPTSFSKKTV